MLLQDLFTIVVAISDKHKSQTEMKKPRKEKSTPINGKQQYHLSRK